MSGKIVKPADAAISAAPFTGGSSKNDLQNYPPQIGLTGRVRRALGWVPILIGWVFLYFGIGKLFYVGPTALSISFVFHSASVSRVLAVVVTALDLYVGCLLLFSKEKKTPLLVAIASLVVYSGFLAFLMSLDHPPGCGCGGRFQFFQSNRANAAAGLLRNICLFGMAVAYLRFGSTPTRAELSSDE